MSYFSEQALSDLGLASVGLNCKISDRAVFYNPSKIKIGSNVRIDDFVIISSGEEGVFVGNYIHIGPYSGLFGREKIVLQDYCNISSRVSLYTSNDDYSGNFMTSPQIPQEFTNISSSPVILNKHVIVGSGAVILPGVELGTGAVVGALSLVKESCKAFEILAGSPAKIIGMRRDTLLDVEREFKKAVLGVD